MDSFESLDEVDSQIYQCLTPGKQKSFFLFAGAGSGKTRTLVKVLDEFRNKRLRDFKLRSKKIAVITFTNAACNEIRERLDFNDSFHVRTIHSFSWDLIRLFQHDIKEWLRDSIVSEINVLDKQQRKGRAGTKAAIEREVKISSKTNRLKNLDSITAFTYNPNGLNNDKESLTHVEVIKIASIFLSEKPLLQQILIGKFPILLIDESQDTQKDLIDAFMNVQSQHKESFSLGLVGDLMQRIYSDGKVDLGNQLPSDWITPEKTINYRCPKRIVKLINCVRKSVDGHEQHPYKKNEGFIRLFIIDADQNHNKLELEQSIGKTMSKITGDVAWKDVRQKVKTLTLEHHMAARRGGFYDFFMPLYSGSRNSTGVIDGSLPGISFFVQIVIPLFDAIQANNEFLIAQIVKKHSKLLEPRMLEKIDRPTDQIKIAQQAVNSLKAIFQTDNDPSISSILSNISESKLFPIPEVFEPLLASFSIGDDETQSDSEEEPPRDKNLEAWEQALDTSLSQLKAYNLYISDKSGFGTHQGVKGLQFPRVMVILDDEESRGFMFSYEKLFGAQEKTATDLKNETEGKETGIDRTRRLFYVTCSRAEESLAVVAYTQNSKAVKNHVINQGWFEENEIIDDI